MLNNRLLFTSLLFLTMLIFNGCAAKNIQVKTPESNVIVIDDAEIPNFQNLNDRQFEVQELQVIDNAPSLNSIGEVKNGKIYLPYGNELRYGDSYPEQYYDPKDGKVKVTGRFACSVPDNFWQNVKNDKGETICEGIIVFEKVPFSFYYNENGEPYVKCLETRFHSYFKEDRSYVEFINFAINYEPVDYVTEEDLLSR